MPLKWEPIYSVNVKEIDGQHRKMFDIINRLLAVKEEVNRKTLMSILQEIKDYGDYHLVTEEKYFKQYNYPDEKAHVETHNTYRDKVKYFEKKFTQDNINLAESVRELSRYIQDWWLHHIQDEDQKYSTFFNLKGLY